MRLKTRVLAMLLASVITAGGISTASAKEIKNEQTVDLKKLSFTIKNGKVFSEGINTSSTNLSSFNDPLIQEIFKDSFYKESLKDSIEKGYKPSQVSYVDKYVKKVHDLKSDTILVKEISKEEYDNNFDNASRFTTRGSQPTVAKGKLRLYTTLSGSKGEYWVQANASWNMSGVWVSGSDNPSVGDDFIGVGWDDKYVTKSNPSATGTYNMGPNIKFVTASNSPREGLVWSFDEFSSYAGEHIYAKNMYAGVGVKTTNYNLQTVAFKSTYVHTWSSIAYGINIGAGGSVSVSPTKDQWSVAHSLTDNCY